MGSSHWGVLAAARGRRAREKLDEKDVAAEVLSGCRLASEYRLWRCWGCFLGNFVEGPRHQIPYGNCRLVGLLTGAYCHATFSPCLP